MHGFAGLIPLLIATIPLIFICRRLAQEKQKDVALWTVLGFIPIVNYFAITYLIGTTNQKIEDKIDYIIHRLEKIEGEKGA